MKSIIQSHNRKLNTKPTQNLNQNPCNCRNKDLCLAQGKCQQPVVYKATLKANNNDMIYIGSTNNFKRRYYAHKASFKNPKQQNDTTFSTFVWEKGLNPEPPISWEILCIASPCGLGSNHCDLCLSEKMYICEHIDNRMCLNKRSEIAQKCRHKYRHQLANMSFIYKHSSLT